MTEYFVGIMVNIPEFGIEQAETTSRLLIEALQKRTNNLKLTTLLGNAVTYRNVKQLLEECNEYLSHKNRRAIIYYNGHGGQTKDLNGDEEDGMDEFWELAKGKRMIDDEISEIFSDISEKSFLIMINDNCSSGTMIDKALNDRPWVCLSSCQDHQDSLACRQGGIFTLSGVIPGIEKRDTIRGIHDEILRGIQIKTQTCMLTMTRDYLLNVKLFE
jgi:hypothetical protein